MARILVVEDEDNSAIALEFVLFRDGRFPARQFRGGAARVAIRQERPDLMVLDVMLLDLSGDKIVELLRADPAMPGGPHLADDRAWIGRGAPTQTCPWRGRFHRQPVELSEMIRLLS